MRDVMMFLLGVVVYFVGKEVHVCGIYDISDVHVFFENNSVIITIIPGECQPRKEIVGVISRILLRVQ